ncbi:MAG: hypothetical protein R3E86_00985 [Pseudomonadales bacterium]
MINPIWPRTARFVAVGARFLAGLIVCLSGCASLSPAGLIAAARLDPLETDPADLAVAAVVPLELRLRDGDVTLLFSYAPSGDDAAVDELFALRLVEPADPATLGLNSNERAYVADIAPEDRDRLRRAQATVRRYRAMGDDGSGTLALDLRGACFVGPRPDRLPFRGFLRTNRDDRFVQLVWRRNLLTDLEAAQRDGLQTRLAPCPSSAANSRTIGTSASGVTRFVTRSGTGLPYLASPD